MNGDAEKVLEWFLGDNSIDLPGEEESKDVVYGKRARKIEVLDTPNVIARPVPVPEDDDHRSDAQTYVHSLCYFILYILGL